MTRVDGNHIIIEPESPDRCSGCGKTTELRPYGPGGTEICIDCADKDPKGVMREMMKFMGIPTTEEQLDSMVAMSQVLSKIEEDNNADADQN